MFEQRREEASLLSEPGAYIGFAEPWDIEGPIALVQNWDISTVSVLCGDPNTAGGTVLLQCTSTHNDAFTREAPYDWSLDMRVTVEDLRVTRVDGFGFVDPEVTIDGETKIVSEWVNDWLLKTYPGGVDGVSDECSPAPGVYCAALFLATAEQFWAESPQIVAGLAP